MATELPPDVPEEIRNRMRNAEKSGMHGVAFQIDARLVSGAVQASFPDYPAALVQVLVLLTSQQANNMSDLLEREVAKAPEKLRAAVAVASQAARILMAMVDEKEKPEDAKLARGIAEHIYALSYSARKEGR